MYILFRYIDVSLPFNRFGSDSSCDDRLHKQLPIERTVKGDHH